MNAETTKEVMEFAVAHPGRVKELFREQQQNIVRHADRLFAWLMIGQWFFAVWLAYWLSPRTWSGTESQIHPHVWLAIFLGGIITFTPVLMAWLWRAKS